MFQPRPRGALKPYRKRTYHLLHVTEHVVAVHLELREQRIKLRHDIVVSWGENIVLKVL